MIGAPQYDTAANDTLRQSFTGGLPGDYFIGKVQIHDSNAGQFSETIVRGQRADSGAATTARPASRITEAELHPVRPSYRSTAAPYKPKYFHDRSSRDPVRALSCAKLEMGLRAAQAFYVQGEVDGFISSTGRIWQVDTMVRVVVEAEGLDEDMWLCSVERMQSADASGSGGQRTRLRLLPKYALVLGDIPQ
jgi:prophage tail gpP-like protein